MKECIICGDEFEPKNPKGIYCSSICRQKDYRKRIAKVLKSARQIESEDQNSDSSDDPAPPKTLKSGGIENHMNIPINDNEAVLIQIKAIKDEKIPDHRNKSEIGRKSWRLEQEKRIKELMVKLKQ